MHGIAVEMSRSFPTDLGLSVPRIGPSVFDCSCGGCEGRAMRKMQGSRCHNSHIIVFLARASLIAAVMNGVTARALEPLSQAVPQAPFPSPPLISLCGFSLKSHEDSDTRAVTHTHAVNMTRAGHEGEISFQRECSNTWECHPSIPSIDSDFMAFPCSSLTLMDDTINSFRHALLMARLKKVSPKTVALVRRNNAFKQSMVLSRVRRARHKFEPVGFNNSFSM